jgi:hypothetical protein
MLVSQPLIQNSPTTANVFIFMSFLIALFNYVRFGREVIWQMRVLSHARNDVCMCKAQELTLALEPSTLASRALL